MKWFNNLKIKGKMLVGFSVIIALLATLAVFAVYEMREVDIQNTYVIHYPGERKTAVLEFQSALRDFRRTVTSIAMYSQLNEPTRIASAVEDAHAMYDLCVESLERYEELIVNDPKLTNTEKNIRMEKARELMAIVGNYNDEIRGAVEEHALKGEYEQAVGVVTSGAELIANMRSTTLDLILDARNASDHANAAATGLTERATIYIVIFSALAALISVIIALYFAGMISKPLTLLSLFMNKAGTYGDLTLAPEDVRIIGKLSASKDEIGQAISGCALFVKHVTSIAGDLGIVANGDLTTDIKVLSESDVLGVSLKKMSDNLNGMFSEVQSSANQVSAGSRQVAIGAQTLAQGATEQAMSIEELSNSIADIAEKTKTNAATSDKTAKLSMEIKANAEKGSRQMDEMISAVGDINDASKNISRIIKTIDDIAFQTNILALNAAVEAARAGQHGKGFAVVAEEVRNLASKSAEAARDTGNMIQNSMEKAELGSRIAGETASSLKDIVSGINESSNLIAEIAGASEEQSQDIEHINSGIEQVAQVVQLNSATAEESAAASGAISSQSDALQKLIAQFKLVNQIEENASLPAANWTTSGRLAIPSLNNYEITDDIWSQDRD